MAREAEAQKLKENGQENTDTKVYKPAVTKLSSAGLIYKFFGKEIITNVCKTEYDIELT